MPNRVSRENARLRHMDPSEAESVDGTPKAAREERDATGRSGKERAVLVSVEFTTTGHRHLPTSAKMARNAASLQRGEVEDPSLMEASSPIPTDEVTSRPDQTSAVAELEELARSAGAEVLATICQRRARADAATLVGPGKVKEIEAIVLSSAADLVLFDRDLTPSQLRNLEEKLPCRVIDRTQLILDIFARHARTREGQLQVELAQLEYQLPRLAGRGKSMSQLGGGIGTRGPGETQLETDRRRINQRIDRVREQLEGVRRIRRQQRQRREGVPVPVVALVGYTNAGKSTLFNALTAAGVLESSRMFATLDTKLRQIRLPSRRKILLSDTVGFIADLPHGLVTSFRATLEEVERAELLLHVQDAASPTREEQRREVLKVLGELDVSETPVLDVLNKIDLVPAAEHLAEDGAIAVSGLQRTGLQTLLLAIDAALVEDPLIEIEMRVPQSDGRAIAAIEAGATLEAKRFEGNVAYLRAVGPASLLHRYRRYFLRDSIPLEKAESGYKTKAASEGSGGGSPM
jgi:GTP-binding protein HflX